MILFLTLNLLCLNNKIYMIPIYFLARLFFFGTSFVFFLISKHFAAGPVAPFDGVVVDIVASLHLADGIVYCVRGVMFYTCYVFWLRTKNVIIFSTFLLISSFSYLFLFSFIRVSCLNWLSIICGS